MRFNGYLPRLSNLINNSRIIDFVVPDFILLPVCCANHFVLVIIDVKSKVLILYNPMLSGGPNRAQRSAVTTELLAYFTRRYKARDNSVDFTEFKVLRSRISAAEAQTNGRVCGVFLLGKASSIFNTGRIDIKILPDS